MYCILLCTCVAGKEMGVLGCVGDHILQDESKEKHNVWEPMPELTITSPYVDSDIYLYARVDLNPMPESTLTLRQSRT
jgi:hypothetical protein